MKRAALIVVLSFVGVQLLVAGLAEGQGALVQGRFAEAAEAFRGVLRNDPSNLPAHAGLSTALYLLARYDEVIAFFPEEIRKGRIDLNRRGTEAMTVLKHIGFSCYRGGQSKKAIVALSIAVKIKDDDPAVYNTLGLAYLNTASFRLAEIAFQTAVNLSPKSPFYHNNLGAAYLEQKMFREALACFEKAVRNDGGYQNGWENIWLTREKLNLPSNRGDYHFAYFITATEDEKTAWRQRETALRQDSERRRQEAIVRQRMEQERRKREAELKRIDEERRKQEAEKRRQDELRRQREASLNTNGLPKPPTGGITQPVRKTNTVIVKPVTSAAGTNGKAR